MVMSTISYPTETHMPSVIIVHREPVASLYRLHTPTVGNPTWLGAVTLSFTALQCMPGPGSVNAERMAPVRCDPISPEQGFL